MQSDFAPSSFHTPRCSKPKILIVADGHLIVQIKVEKLARSPRLHNSAQEIQPGHLPDYSS